jgi:hypothetical protein
LTSDHRENHFFLPNPEKLFHTACIGMRPNPGLGMIRRTLPVSSSHPFGSAIRNQDLTGKKGIVMNQTARLKPVTPSLLTRLHYYGKHCGQVAAALCCFAFSSTALGVVPPPSGCYPNYTTAEGCSALNLLTTGAGNTGLGWYALYVDTTGSFNTGVGGGALALNNADSNTAVGAGALLLNTSGAQNTAVGTNAMAHNDTGDDNTAMGAFALFDNIVGFENTAVGIKALYSNVGQDNCAFGDSALFSNTTGLGNNAFGVGALAGKTTGSGNSAFGSDAMLSFSNGDNNTAIGDFAGVSLSTGGGNVYIGEDVEGQITESNHTYIRNINTTTVSGVGVDAVTVDLSTGLLGHLSSSRRYKQDIQPMESASETLYRLKPVTYRYKKQIDPSQCLDYGLVAEEVAKVDPNLASRNRDGQIESVRYNAINAMLLNEFLKEHKKVRKLEATVAQQQEKFESRLAQQEKQIESLTVGLQKVSAQIQMSKAAPQVMVKNP